MQRYDLRDILSGLILISFGLCSTVYAASTLPLGTLTRIGPGMFPVSLGVILALFGLAILVPALCREGVRMPKIEYRSLTFILLSVLAFALLIQSFGLFPAIAALIVIASRADSKLSILGTLILAAVLALASVVIFDIGLGMPIEAFDWP